MDPDAYFALGESRFEKPSPYVRRHTPAQPEETTVNTGGPHVYKRCSCGYENDWPPAFAKHLKGNPDHIQVNGLGVVPPCGAVLLLMAVPFMSVAASCLDAWALRIVLARFTSWTLTFGEAFALSLGVALLIARRPPKELETPAVERFVGEALTAFGTPLLIVLIAFVASFVGVTR